MELPSLITIFLLLVSSRNSEELEAISVGELVGVFPNTQTLAQPGGNVTFTCLPLYTTSNKLESAEWIINGSQLEDSQFTNLDARFSPIGNGLSILRITSVSMDYNNTRIQCRAQFSEGEISDSNLATIYIQPDYLGPVESLAVRRGQGSEVVVLSWVRPFFSTDLTFCVRVTSSLSHKDDSRCGLTASMVSYHLPRAACEIYSFAVHPVNSEGEKGPVATTSYFGARTRPSIKDFEMLNQTDMITYSITMSAPVCTGDVKLVDVDSGESSATVDITLNITDSVITFSSHKLQKSRRYNITLSASNIAGSTSENFEISTHSVDNFTIKANESDFLILTEYSEDSEAKGVLFYFIPLTEDGMMNPDVPPRLLPLSRTTSMNHTLDKTYTGRIKVMAYDIGRNGTLPSGINYPANRQDLYLGGSGGNQSPDKQNLHLPSPRSRSSRSVEPEHIGSCRISVTGMTITSQCTFNNNLRYQMIARLVDTSRIEERLFSSLSSDRQSPASVEVEENGSYQVTIFAVTAASGVLDSEVQYSENVEISDYNDFMEPQRGALGSQSPCHSTAWVVWMLAVLLCFMPPR